MKLYNRYLRVTIFPDLNPLFEKRAREIRRALTYEEKLKIQSLYPPVIINKNPDEFRVACSIIRESNKATQLVLEITNLSAFIRLHILNASYKRITVEAGYLGSAWKLGNTVRDADLDILFKGSLIWMGTKIEARKNVITSFLGISGNAEALASYPGLMALNYQAGYNLYQLINEIYINSNNPDIRLSITEEDKQKLLETTTGAVKPTDLGQILKNFSIDMIYDWSGTSTFDVDDYINLNSSENEQKIYPINSETGLINIPSMNGDRRLVFSMILNSKIKLFDYVRLNNYDINLPLLDDWTNLDKANSGYYLDKEGIYRIMRISYSLDSRGNDFIMEVEAIARDVYAQTTGNT
jgi:hypothetical protein